MHAGDCCSKAVKAEWPASWSEEQRKAFALRISLFGISGEHMPALAANLEVLGAVEQDLVDYLLLGRVSQEKIIQIHEAHTKRLEKPVKILLLLHISKQESILKATLKMAILFAVSPLFFLGFLPFRFYSWFQMNRIVRSFPKTFGQYLSDKSARQKKS